MDYHKSPIGLIDFMGPAGREEPGNTFHHYSNAMKIRFNYTRLLISLLIIHMEFSLDIHFQNFIGEKDFLRFVDFN